MQLSIGNAFHGHNVPTDHGTEGNQTTVHGLVLGLPSGILSQDDNRTGTTISIAAAFLGSRPSALA
jgi:hypothetical protein